MKYVTSRWYEYISVILILLTSGSVVFYHNLSPGVAISIYFLWGLFFHYNYNKQKHPNREGLKYVLLLVVLIAISFLCNMRLDDNQIIGYTLQALGSYLILSKLDFYVFRRILLNCVCCICIISIPIYLLVINQIIAPTYTLEKFYLAYGITVGWPPYIFDRLAGIYHEPGAFQIILNYVAILYIRDIKECHLAKIDVYKLAIIFIALLMTRSTTGYITLMLLILAVVYKASIWKYKLAIIPMLVVSVLLVFLLVNSSSVQDKFNPEDGVSQSLVVRTSDNLAMLQMIREKPLSGYGLGSYNYKKRSETLDNISSSNGILHTAASIGVLWFIFFIIRTYKSIKLLDLKTPTFFILLMILILQSGERFIEHPISYTILIPFLSYNKDYDAGYKN